MPCVLRHRDLSNLLEEVGLDAVFNVEHNSNGMESCGIRMIF